MPKYINCPFYQYDLENVIKCEGHRIYFRDRAVLRAYTSSVCGDVHDYKKCAIAQILEKKYEVLDLKKEEIQKELNNAKRLIDVKIGENAKLRHQIEHEAVKRQAAVFYLVALMKKMGEMSIDITKEELITAAKGQVSIEMGEGFYRLKIVNGGEKE